MVEYASRTNLSYCRDYGIEEDSIDDMPLKSDPECYDDDGHLKRTGTIWTTSSHIITAVVGSGVLSLAWAIAQMGWIAGPAVMILFSIVTLYTSSFLADCYRTGDPMFGKRNYTFMDAVSTILGGYSVTFCGIVQYLNLFGSAIGYTIAASLSMMAIQRSHCIIQSSDGENQCNISSIPYTICFGAVQIFFSQIPDFHNMWWLSIVASVMSFTYSIIGLVLGITKIAETGTFKGSLTGISIGTVTEAQKVWGVFQALGNIAFAYSYSFVLLEIQDTIKSPPSEVKTMKKAAKLSIAVTTTFYMLCGCVGYAAFGDSAPGNLLAGFGFHKLYWLVDIANAAIVIHLVGAYQVYAQPLFAFVEKETAKRWPNIVNFFQGLQHMMMEEFKILFVFLMTLLLVLKVTISLWWRPRKIEGHFSNQGIRGPPYRFFIGNVKELVGMMMKASEKPMPFSHNILPRVLSFYHHWKKIYGATFLVWFGPTVRVTISDPDLIREIFTSKSELYEKNESPPLVKQLEGDGLLSLKGEKWAHHRKIISPTFHMENLKMLIPIMATSVVEMLEKWKAMAEEKGEVEIEVSECFQTLTEDVITRTAFGSSYEDGKAVFRLQAQQMVLAADAFQKVFIPGYRFFPTRRNINSWKLDKEIKKSLVKIIERRRKENACGKEETKRPTDLLGLMIWASNNNNNTTSNVNVTVDDIVEECKTFFFAGKHTTSNLLTWTTILLAMHPQWQIRAREELVSVCGARHIPTKEDLAKLKTLSMIVNESLRLYPPTIATIRRTKADVELGPYKIPCGTELLIPILAVHHDQATWGSNATEFNPGRFSNGVSRAARLPFAFIPFGLGARTCIGQNLALLQTKLTLAVMVRGFNFRLAPTYQHAPTVLMLLYPQYGAPIRFQPIPAPTVNCY